MVLKKTRWRIQFPRDVLLVEIERRCRDAACNARMRIGLTKEDARAYCGFECERCERWHDDALSERDVPDWWEELTVTGMQSLRPAPFRDDETTEVVQRLSDEWRHKLESDGATNDSQDRVKPREGGPWQR